MAPSMSIAQSLTLEILVANLISTVEIKSERLRTVSERGKWSGKA